MEAANGFLEKEYWPEWNARFARPLAGVSDLHRPLTGEIDLAASLSHVESRLIGNDYTISFASRRYQIAGCDVEAGMKRGRVRIELRLDGKLKARYQGRYVEIFECGKKPPATTKQSIKPVRKDHNAGGKSQWMQGFLNKPVPQLWQAISLSNARN
jgi:hypothetical protein